MWFGSSIVGGFMNDGDDSEPATVPKALTGSELECH